MADKRMTKKILNNDGHDQPNRYRPMARPATFATLPAGLRWEYVEAPWDLAHVRSDLPRQSMGDRG